MKYRNVKTGEVIEVPSKLGGNWELIGGDKAEKPAAVVPDVPVEVKEDVKPVKKTEKKTTTKKTAKK